MARLTKPRSDRASSNVTPTNPTAVSKLAEPSRPEWDGTHNRLISLLPRQNRFALLDVYFLLSEKAPLNPSKNLSTWTNIRNSSSMSHPLSYQATEPQSMEEMVCLCQSLDNRQRAEQYRRSLAWPCHSHELMGNTIGTSSHLVSTPLATSMATGTRSGPMDTSAGKTRAKWVTPEVVAERRAKGMCVRCGSKQHFVSQCMLLPARCPQAAAAQTQASAVPEYAASLSRVTTSSELAMKPVYLHSDRA